MSKRKLDILPQTIIVSSFTLSGVALIGLIHAFDIDWYLPTLAFVAVAYFSWQRFF